MTYKTSFPVSQLSGLVKHFWGLDSCLPANKEHIQRIIPTGLPELIFYFDDQPVINTMNGRVNATSFITGQLNTYYDLRVSGRISLFSVVFKPHGLSAFLNIPASELCNQHIPLRFIFKNFADELETKLFEAKSFLQRVQIVEDWLLLLLRFNKENYHQRRISQTISRINSSKGLIDIDSLAYHACLGRKQFERTFSNIIGITPKQFLKIIRFQHAINQKTMKLDMSLTQLTYAVGYYDQAHMINDFQKLSGMTPRQLFSGCETQSDYFQ